MKTIPAFRSGRHTDMNGTVVNITAADLAATADAYDPALHEAPLVVGHPVIDAPAYGWAERFEVQDQQLVAIPKQVEPQFAQMVDDGRFKKVSISFFMPDSPDNPRPGVWYPKHIGFLGAAAPAIKGLKPVSFAAPVQGVASFAQDLSDGLLAGFLRRFREFLIGDKGAEVADQVIPNWTVEALAAEAMREPDQGAVTAFGSEDDPAKSEFEGGFAPVSVQPNPVEVSVTPEEKTAIEAENTRLKAELEAMQAQQVQAKTEAVRTGHAAFAQSLVQEGKLSPQDLGLVVELLMLTDNGQQAVSFADQGQQKPVGDAFKALLNRLPKQALFTEAAGRERDAQAVSFAAPTGYGVSADAAGLHAKAKAYAAQHKTDFLTAYKAVGGQ